MFKNALVISDNPVLCKGFMQVLERRNKPDCKFTFAVSPYSKKENFGFIADRLKVLDLRKTEDVAFIRENYDLVFSMHCKQIFPAELVNHLQCINIHPGYNPVNRGWYPQVFAIINNSLVGATIHEIDELLDHGAIIARATVPIYAYDTSSTLYNRITEKELELLEENLDAIIQGSWKSFQPDAEGKLYLKKDFNNLLKLDLEEKVRVGDFLNKLRALTHEGYDNAYFMDPETGKKIFVTLNLKVENAE